MCDTLFHTRLEWDDHKLSSDHLRKVGEQRRQFNPDLKDDEFELLDVIVIEDDVHSEEIPVALKSDMLDDQDMKDDEEEEDQDIEKESKDNEVLDNIVDGEKEENDNSKEENDVSKEENDVSAVENDVSKEANDISEIENDTSKTENDTSKTENNNSKEENNIDKELNDTAAKEDTLVIKKEKDEKYNPANVVGRELVVKTGGYVCRICAMFMKNDEEADLHCQTASHYINFTTITKLHVSIIYFAK